jgi:hypothetical protein
MPSAADWQSSSFFLQMVMIFSIKDSFATRSAWFSFRKLSHHSDSMLTEMKNRKLLMSHLNSVQKTVVVLLLPDGGDFLHQRLVRHQVRVVPFQEAQPP